jgi:hypothetical protein
MSSDFNCSYMAMSSLTYNPDFSVIFFFPVLRGHLWDKEKVAL